MSRERRRGVEHVLLPGGRVRDGESIIEALVREVAEETGLDVVPERRLYVAEVVGSYGAHDLNLVWLAQLRDARRWDRGHDYGETIALRMAQLLGWAVPEPKR